MENVILHVREVHVVGGGYDAVFAGGEAHPHPGLPAVLGPGVMAAQPSTGVMAASEIPPQMANFQTFFLAAFYFLLAAKTAHFAHYYFVLNSSLSAQKQHILVFRNTPNCSSVHSGMTGISL